MLLVFISLNSVLRCSFSILDTVIWALYLDEQGFEYPFCFFFEAERGPRAQKFWKNWTSEQTLVCRVRSYACVLPTVYKTLTLNWV